LIVCDVIDDGDLET